MSPWCLVQYNPKTAMTEGNRRKTEGKQPIRDRRCHTRMRVPQQLLLHWLNLKHNKTKGTHRGKLNTIYSHVRLWYIQLQIWEYDTPKRTTMAQDKVWTLNNMIHEKNWLQKMYSLFNKRYGNMKKKSYNLFKLICWLVNIITTTTNICINDKNEQMILITMLSE